MSYRRIKKAHNYTSVSFIAWTNWRIIKDVPFRRFPSFSSLVPAIIIVLMVDNPSSRLVNYLMFKREKFVRAKRPKSVEIKMRHFSLFALLLGCILIATMGESESEDDENDEGRPEHYFLTKEEVTKIGGSKGAIFLGAGKKGANWKGARVKRRHQKRLNDKKAPPKKASR